MPTECDNFDANVLAQVPSIRRIGKRWLRNTGELDDFTQEVLLRAYAHRAQIREPEKLAQWLAAIARNTAMKWNRRRTPLLLEKLPELPQPTAENDDDESERWTQLTQALAILDSRSRELLSAYYLEGAGYEELAERYGLSHKTLSSRLARARERLRLRVARMFGAFVGFVSIRAREAVAYGVSVVVHLLVGFGLFALWQPEADEVRRRGSVTAETPVFLITEPPPKKIEPVETPPTESPAEPPKETPTKAFHPGADGYAVIENPNVFEPAYAEGLTIEIALYLTHLPQEGETWILFAKPGSFHLVLRGPSFEKSAFEKTQPEGTVYLDSYTWTQRPHEIRSAPNLFTMALARDALPLHGRIALAAEVHGAGPTRVTLVYQDTDHAGVGMGMAPEVTLARSDHPMFVGGMDAMTLESADSASTWGGADASLRGGIEQLRLSRSSRYFTAYASLSEPIAVPTHFDVDENTIALWRFDGGSPHVDQSGNAYTLREGK